MPSSQTTTNAPKLASVLEAKGIKFQIKTGSAKYTCHLQDRAAYERMKAKRTDSVDSTSTTSSTNSH